MRIPRVEVKEEKECETHQCVLRKMRRNVGRTVMTKVEKMGRPVMTRERGLT